MRRLHEDIAVALLAVASLCGCFAMVGCYVVKVPTTVIEAYDEPEPLDVLQHELDRMRDDAPRDVVDVFVLTEEQYNAHMALYGAVLRVQDITHRHKNPKNTTIDRQEMWNAQDAVDAALRELQNIEERSTS